MWKCRPSEIRECGFLRLLVCADDILMALAHHLLIHCCIIERFISHGINAIICTCGLCGSNCLCCNATKWYEESVIWTMESSNYPLSSVCIKLCLVLRAPFDVVFRLMDGNAKKYLSGRWIDLVRNVLLCPLIWIIRVFSTSHKYPCNCSNTLEVISAKFLDIHQEMRYVCTITHRLGPSVECPDRKMTTHWLSCIYWK